MKNYLLYFFASFLLIGCSSSNDNQLNPDTENEFEGRWVLIDYTLDNGIVKTVPDDVRVGINVLLDGTMRVTPSLCKFYDISYVIDNGVLTTSNPVSPDLGCAAYYGDADNRERSNLVNRSFFNSQLLTTVVGNSLTVTTTQNELLNFERSIE